MGTAVNTPARLFEMAHHCEPCVRVPAEVGAENLQRVKRGLYGLPGLDRVLLDVAPHKPNRRRGAKTKLVEDRVLVIVEGGELVADLHQAIPTRSIAL